MRAGQLRAIVKILQPVVANGIQTWNTPASVLCQTRAHISAQFGTEQPAGGGPPNELRSQVSIRYRPGVQVQPRMRVAVVGTSRVLEIDSVIDPDLRHRELTLACREVAP